MNRIREIREAAGLSQQDLADMVGTSQAQIGRLEKGERKLTVAWIGKLSEALGVTPADMITQALIVGTEDDVEAVDLASLPGWAAAMRSRGLVVYTVKANSVERAGLKMGDTVTIDQSGQAEPATGAVVLVEIDGVRVLRQLVSPQLLVTNKSGGNIAVQADAPLLRITIIGVVLPRDP